MKRPFRSGDKLVVPLSERIIGRLTASEVLCPSNGQELLGRNHAITEADAIRLEQAGVEEVHVRSVLTCDAVDGPCSACYGWDRSRRALAERGLPVGILASHAIGEPAAQAILKSVHTGGELPHADGLDDAGDLVQIIGRLERQFEVRKSATRGRLALCAGRVRVEKYRSQVKIHVDGIAGPTQSCPVCRPEMAAVEDGQQVQVGDRLTKGIVCLQDMLSCQGEDDLADTFIAGTMRLLRLLAPVWTKRTLSWSWRGCLTGST